MVHGILTIPLPGQSNQLIRGPGSHARGLGEFVAGSENALAVQALRPYLDRAPQQDSLLVLYGPHGSGKSHLAHGLAEWWRRSYPGDDVASLTAAEFAQAHASAVEGQRLEAWRQEVRGASLFVLEDLGQLTGKRPAQQELLHALDALADRGAAVVVTARLLPTHWGVLLPALRSRLSAGLAVQLALPGRTARRAILERLIVARGMALPKRVVQDLAERMNSSAAALISALLELELSAGADGQGIAPEQLEQFVAERGAQAMPTLREIARLTAKYFGLTVADLKGPSRRQPLVAARGVAMYLARLMTSGSLQQIGAFFGHRDHTTVMNGCRRTENLLRRDSATRQAVGELKNLLMTTRTCFGKNVACCRRPKES